MRRIHFVSLDDIEKEKALFLIKIFINDERTFKFDIPQGDRNTVQ